MRRSCLCQEGGGLVWPRLAILAAPVRFLTNAALGSPFLNYSTSPDRPPWRSWNTPMAEWRRGALRMGTMAGHSAAERGRRAQPSWTFAAVTVTLRVEWGEEMEVKAQGLRSETHLRRRRMHHTLEHNCLYTATRRGAEPSRLIYNFIFPEFKVQNWSPKWEDKGLNSGWADRNRTHSYTDRKLTFCTTYINISASSERDLLQHKLMHTISLCTVCL